MKKNIILIGAGGHANSCINTIVSSKKFTISFLVNNSSDKKTNSTEFKTINEKVFLKKKLEGKNILIALGQLKTGELREDKFNFFKKRKCNFPVIKSNHSLISDNTKIKEGTIIMHYVIINNRVTIEHDCIIEDNVHIAPGAIILGGCHIKKNSFIGSGSVIKQCSVLKRNSIIPAKIYFK